MIITRTIIKKLNRVKGLRGNPILGKTSYDLPVNLVKFMHVLKEQGYDFSLERNTIEGLPISDILTPNSKNITNSKVDPAFNPIKKKMKKRSYTQPVKVIKPSEHEPLLGWANKNNYNNWTPFDFLGYYFYKYKDYYEYEDPSFVGSKWTKSGKTKGKLNNFMMVSKSIESFIEFMDEMEYGNDKVKEYLDFVFDKWLKTNGWYKADITPYKLFSTEKNYLFGQYFKEVLNKKKKKSSYNPMGVIG